jgi:hypothetical protein
MIHWRLREQSYERSTTMQEENDQKMGEEVSKEETAPAEGTEPEKEKEPEHDAVSPGGVCKLCGWTWGDPVKGISPHIVHFGAYRQEPEQVVPPPVAAHKESGPNACEAVSVNATCPKCGWNYAEEMKKPAPAPHPVLV